MAGRKDKNVVDYFPHSVITGKTLFIVENKYGHLGYAIWFKTLELLGSSENHYIDLREETDLLFLISKMKVTEEQLINIYNLFAKLGAIDLDLWECKIVFSDNFVKNIEDAYKRRGNNVLHKYDLCTHKLNLSTHQLNKCIHKSTKESKVKESKVKESKEILFEQFWNLYNKKEDKKKCLDKWLKLEQEEIDKIFEVVENYVKSKPEVKFRKNPLTWLSGKNWNDEIEVKKTYSNYKVKIPTL